MGAAYPEKDPEYSKELERQYLKSVVNERLSQLEKQRMEFLSEDFDPGNDWWGSVNTKD